MYFNGNEKAAGLNRRESTHSHSNLEGDDHLNGGQSTKNKNQLNSSSSSSSANVSKSKQKPNVNNNNNNNSSQAQSNSPVVPVFLTTQQQSNNGNNNSSANLHVSGTGRHVDQFPKIGEAYGQLNNLVEVLEEKVEGVIERHEAEFLVAYKNQMQKIRKELQEMKNNMDEQEKKLKAGDQLDELEKQLAWFRDESLKLYSKLASKDKQIADFKQIMLDQKKEISFNETQITALKKKIRFLAKKASVNSGIESEHTSQLNSLSQLHTASINNRSTIRNTVVEDRSAYMPPVTSQSFKQQGNQSIANRRPVSVDHMNKNAAGQLQSNPWSFNQSGQNFNMLTAQQQFLLNDVVEQNETQGSQIGLEEQQQQEGKGGVYHNISAGQQMSYSNWGNTTAYNNNNNNSNNAQQVILQQQQFEGWMPQSEFIAEMIAKFSESDPIRLVKELTQMFRVEEEKKNKQIRTMKERLEKVIKEKLTQNVVRSDLENFFLECIETVRKQIIKRKPGGLMRSKNDTQLNFYLNQIKDYSVFRTEDKIKIIELLLSNERLIMFLYQKIFPQNFAKFVNHAIESGGTGTQPNSSRGNPNKIEELPETSYNVPHEYEVISKNMLQKMKDAAPSNIINKETDELAKLIENIGFPDYSSAPSQFQSEEAHYGVQEYHAKTAGTHSRSNRISRPSTSQNPSLRQYGHGSGQNTFSVDAQTAGQVGSGTFLNAQTTKQFGQDKFETSKPNLTKQKIASLINSDFSSFPNRTSFKANKAAYKAY